VIGGRGNILGWDEKVNKAIVIKKKTSEIAAREVES
jgi:hypothetical protein